MGWIITSACVVGGWTLLRIIGDERQRRVDETEMLNQLQIEQANAPEEPILVGEAVKSH